MLLFDVSGSGVGSFREKRVVDLLAGFSFGCGLNPAGSEALLAAHASAGREDVQIRQRT
jgi:hypothetical protein